MSLGPAPALGLETVMTAAAWPHHLKLVEAWIPAALIAVVIACLPLPAAAFQENITYGRLERVAEMIRQGQLARAEAELEDVLRTQSHDANALNLLGVVRAQQRRDVEAEQLFLRAIKESPRLVGPYVNLGRLYSDKHQPERSLWAYTEAGKLAPDRADINYNLAVIYEERHDFVRAVSFLEKVPRSSWGTSELYLIIKCYLALGRSNEALALVAPLKRPGVLKADEAAGFAALLIEKSLPEEAIALLNAARQQEPSSFVLLYQLGASYAQKRDWNQSEEFYVAALAAKPDSVATMRDLARVARARGELEKALAYLVRARKLAPDVPAILYDFAVVAFTMGLTLDALPIAERLYQKQPDEPAYVHLLAITRFQRDEKAQAEKLLRRYIELRPDEALGYYLLGATLFTIKRYDEARKALEQSLAFGHNADSEYLLGLIADTEGDTEAALRWLQSTLKSDPSYAAAQTLLGVVYVEQKKYSLACATLERAVQLNAKDLRAHYQLGLVYAKLGEKERAEQMFAIADQLRKEQRDEETIKFKLIEPPE
jgi:Flp pilus assembly protein TadD